LQFAQRRDGVTQELVVTPLRLDRPDQIIHADKRFTQGIPQFHRIVKDGDFAF